MRLFIAARLSAAQAAAAEAAQAAFRDAGVRGNYTPAENLHLTLAFIGEYPDPDAVLSAMESARLRPAALTLEGMGAFGDLWWLGLRDDPGLAANVRALRHALADADIPFDRKRFTPHITLLRRAEPGPYGIPAIRVPPLSSPIRRVVLMRSDRGKRGMIYTEVGAREQE